MSQNPQKNPPAEPSPPPARPIIKGPPVRPLAALLFLGCSTVIGIAIYLQPDPRGFGTAEQLNTGPCGMLVMTGFPCLTCGMTTAFAHTVRGQWIQAFWAQPTGFLLALATIATAVVSLWTLFKGRWPRCRIPLITPFRAFLILLILLIGGWVFTIITGLADGSLPYR